MNKQLHPRYPLNGTVNEYPDNNEVNIMNHINLLDKIDKHLITYDKHKRESHYPSQASILTDDGVIGKCLRAQWYSWKEYKPTNPISATSMWKMKMGDSIHTYIARWIREMGYQVEEEYPFKYDHPELKYPISGRADNVIVFPKVNKFYGVECKTGYSKFFTNGKDGVGRVNKPRLSDLLQVCIYLNCTPDLAGMYMIYVARDNALRYQFYINKDNIGVDFDDIISRWKLLEMFLDTNNLPPRNYDIEYDDDRKERLYKEYLEESKAKQPQSLKQWSAKHKGDWACGYCEYLNQCIKDKGGDDER